MNKHILMAAFSITIAVVSCKKDDTTVVANPNNTSVSITKTFKVRYGSTLQYGLFRFSDSSLRPKTDSASTNWDFGIIHQNYAPNIIINSNASGPGAAGVVVQSSFFDSVKTAPTMGYAYDTTATQRAVKSSAWYSYNPQTRLPQLLTPRTFILKTANGINYAKMEMLNIGYDTLINMQPDSLKYTIRFSYQPNGTATF